MTNLNDMIDQFLSNPRTSVRGGWAQVTIDDVTLFREIIQKLIMLKCELDADGDLPIEVTVVNRRTHERLQYSPLPYCEDVGGEVTYSFLERLRLLMGNLSSATNRLNTEIQVACR